MYDLRKDEPYRIAHKNQKQLAPINNILFEELYNQHHSLIFSYIRRQISMIEDAEDVLIDVFLAALENSNLLRWEEWQQRAWLRRVAHNKIIDYRRRVMRYSIVPLDTVTDLLYEHECLAPEEVCFQNEEFAQLLLYILQLSRIQQKVLYMHYVEGLHFADIAQRVHKSNGAVRQIMTRSLHFLRSIYAQKEGDAD